MLWLTPYLTTQLRKAFAISIYVTVLGAQVLEGYWVFVTLARLVKQMMFEFQLPENLNWVYGAQICLIVPLLLMGVYLLSHPMFALMLMMLLQVSYIIELVFVWFDEADPTIREIRAKWQRMRIRVGLVKRTSQSETELRREPSIFDRNSRSIDTLAE